MPRSPTQAMRSMPKRSLSLATCAATVAGSAVLPVNTSTAIGQPSRGADQAEDDLRVVALAVARMTARGQLAAAPRQPGRGQVVQHQGGAHQVLARQGAARWPAAPRAASPAPGTARRPRIGPRPARGPARRWRCRRAACGAWPAWRPARARAPPAWPAAAAATPRAPEPNHVAAPEPRAAPSTAATWPWGKRALDGETGVAGLTATPPLSSTRKCSTSCASQCDRLARVRLTTLPSSR